MFNHESTRRGHEFVTRKISRGVVKIYKQLCTGKPIEPIYLGNLNAKRDWGHANDYIKCMWEMLQQEPEDFVIATGVARSVRDFVETAFGVLNLDIKWSGEGLKEEGFIHGKKA